jgi:predicted DNA-binding WGR domain protein/Leucine-rich repeat (LRR) protein
MKNYFEYQDDKSSKFWEITIDGVTLKTRYGKIGTAGQTTEKTFANEAATQKEYNKLVKEKTSKGYIAVSNDNQEVNTSTAIVKPLDFIKQNPTFGDSFSINEKDINDLEKKLGYKVPVFLKEFWLSFGARQYFNHIKKADDKTTTIKNLNIYSNHNNLNINVYRFYEFFNGLFEEDQVGKNFEKEKEYLNACFWIYGVMNEFVEGKLYFEFFYINALGDHDSYRGEENEAVTFVPLIKKLVAMKSLFKKFLNKADMKSDEKKAKLKPQQTQIEDSRVSNEYIIMSIAAARKKYNINFFPEYYENQVETTNIAVFEHNTYFKELEIDDFAEKQNVKALLFCKNVQAENYIFQEGSDYGPLVIVLGNVIAKNLHLRGSDIFIKGNVTVEQTFIPGDYNHGELTVEGTIQAQLLLGTDDHSFTYDINKIKNTIITGLNSTNPNIKHTEYYLRDVIEKKYFEDDEEESTWWDRDKVIKSLKKGESLLKKKNFDLTKVKTVNEIQAENAAKFLAGLAQEVMDEITRCKEAKDTVLDLRSKNLTELPIQVCDLDFLEHLYLDSNKDLQNLPEALVKLKKLKWLSIAFCDFTIVPEFVTGFTELEILEINGNPIAELPKGFEKLKNLKELNANGTKINSFPEVLYDLPQLESISFAYNKFCNYDIYRVLPSIKELNFSYTSYMPSIAVPLPTLERLSIDIDTMEPIPNAVFECTNLKILEMINDEVTTFPDNLVKLKQFEEIAFSLAKITNVEMLNQMPSLVKVSVSFDDVLPDSFQKLLQVPQWTAFDYNCDYMSYDNFHKAMWPPILKRKNLERIFRGGSEEDLERARESYGVKI